MSCPDPLPPVVPLIRNYEGNYVRNGTCGLSYNPVSSNSLQSSKYQQHYCIYYNGFRWENDRECFNSSNLLERIRRWYKGGNGPAPSVYFWTTKYGPVGLVDVQLDVKHLGEKKSGCISGKDEGPRRNTKGIIRRTPLKSTEVTESPWFADSSSPVGSQEVTDTLINFGLLIDYRSTSFCEQVIEI